LTQGLFIGQYEASSQANLESASGLPAQFDIFEIDDSRKQSKHDCTKNEHFIPRPLIIGRGGAMFCACIDD